MSTNTNAKESSSINWIKQSIADGHTKCYESSDFESIEPIGKGSLGSVVRAKWKNLNQFVVVRSFKNEEIILKEVINEVKYLTLYFKKNSFF